MMNFKNNRLLLTTLLGITLLGGSTGCFKPQGPHIMEFDIARDGKEIMAIFDREWNWLLPGDRTTYAPEVMLAYRAPHADPLYAGRMQIKVLREADTFIGFIAWYLKSPTVGFLNFVVVNPEFRGKRYAEKLVRHALNAMKQQGVQKVTMVTRPWNERARAVYDRIGFTTTGLDDDFVYYEYRF
jgi:ribosomal protein S18 acetylase RimI-like enzyme